MLYDTGTGTVSDADAMRRSAATGLVLQGFEALSVHVGCPSSFTVVLHWCYLGADGGTSDEWHCLDRGRRIMRIVVCCCGGGGGGLSVAAFIDGGGVVLS